MNITIEKEITQEIGTIQEKVFELKVLDPESYRAAGNLLVALKELERKIKNYFKPLKENAYKTWKSIYAREAEELQKLTLPMKYLNEQMTAYNIAEERKRQEEEARLRVEMQKQEEEKRLQIAEELEKIGKKEEAAAIMNEEIIVSTPIMKEAIPKVNGLTMTTIWKWRIIDANLIPREYLRIDEAKINSIVKALKENTKIPGIEVYAEKTMRGIRRT